MHLPCQLHACAREALYLLGLLRLVSFLKYRLMHCRIERCICASCFCSGGRSALSGDGGDVRLKQLRGLAFAATAPDGIFDDFALVATYQRFQTEL